MEAKRDNPLYKYKPISFYSHGPALPNVQDISKRYQFKKNKIFNCLDRFFMRKL